MKGTSFGIYLFVCTCIVIGRNDAIPIPPDQLLGWLVPELCPSGTCPAFNIPVCGSDYVTYTNECFFKQAKCKSDEALAIANYGVCQ